MATSLLSDSEKTQLNAALEDVHATFARPIVVYKEASHVVINTDPNFNPLYNTAGQTTSIVSTPVYETFNVRIQYNYDIRRDYWSESTSNVDFAAQIKVPENVGLVRIKMLASDYEYFKEAKRFDLDGRRYSLTSSFRGHGLFDSQYYTIYLKPTS